MTEHRIMKIACRALPLSVLLLASCGGPSGGGTGAAGTGSGAAGNSGSAGTTGAGGSAGTSGSSGATGSGGTGGSIGGSTGATGGSATAGASGTTGAGGSAGASGATGSGGTAGGAGGTGGNGGTAVVGGRGGNGGATAGSGGTTTGTGGSGGAMACAPPTITLPAGSNAVFGNMVTFNDNGGWCWYQDERAVVDTKTNKLIIGTEASGGTRSSQAEVVMYNLATGGTPMRYTLPSSLATSTVDDHNSPALLIRPGGNYLAQWAGHRYDCMRRFGIF